MAVQICSSRRAGRSPTAKSRSPIEMPAPWQPGVITAVVGYNVQAEADTKYLIVVANEVTHPGHDRSHLLEMVEAA